MTQIVYLVLNVAIAQSSKHHRSIGGGMNREQLLKIIQGINLISEAISLNPDEVTELLRKNGNITEDDEFYIKLGEEP